MKNDGMILAIDPDCEKSGFALLNCKNRRIEYTGALTFPDAVKYLDWAASQYGNDCLVLIEDSDTSTGFHYKRTDKQAVIFAKGRSVGMCHATLRHLREQAQAYGLQVEMMRPLRKCWQGQDRKITHAELSQFAEGLPTRTNQEVRDAVLLSWVYAGFPIRLKTTKR